MEKPDFQMTANDWDRRFDEFTLPSEAFKEGCEHVWNTHVVPLQEENERLINRISAAELSVKEWSSLTKIAESDNKLLREEIERLKAKPKIEDGLNSSSQSYIDVSENI